MRTQSITTTYGTRFLGMLIAGMLFVPFSSHAQLLGPSPVPGIGGVGTSPTAVPGNGPYGTSPNPFVNTWSTVQTAPDPTTAPFDSGLTTITNGGAPTTVSGYCQNYNGTISSGAVSLADVLKYFTCTLQKYIVPLLLAFGMLLFILGMVKFITSAEGEERAEGKQFMIWGVVGFAVIFSVWGILSIFNQTFHLDNSAPTVPTMNPPKING